MKELDLNNLSPDATEAVKAVIGILTGKDHDMHVYEGEKYLFSIHRASEGEIEPGVIKGNAQPKDKPSEVIRKIRENLVSEAVFHRDTYQTLRTEELEDRSASKP